MTLKEFYYQMEDVELIGLSDKGDRHPSHHHFYIDIYDALLSQFEDSPIQLMELGIASGASLLMWSQYFKNGIITGLDIARPPREDYLSALPNTNLIYGDAYDDEVFGHLLANLPKQDVFIEDGAHDVVNQVTALKKYHQLVKPGGYYICEDLFLGNLGEYLTKGVLPLETNRHFTTTIHDYHRRRNGLADDVMIVIQFLD